ncbi:MAG: hypothetical protein OEZ36_09180 [Spirochaetota bacterium]|nr:hypothetical protein [Spirochaetota bacterium]
MSRVHLLCATMLLAGYILPNYGNATDINSPGGVFGQSDELSNTMPFYYINWFQATEKLLTDTDNATVPYTPSPENKSPNPRPSDTKSKPDKHIAPKAKEKSTRYFSFGFSGGGINTFQSSSSHVDAQLLDIGGNKSGEGFFFDLNIDYAILNYLAIETGASIRRYLLHNRGMSTVGVHFPLLFKLKLDVSDRFFITFGAGGGYYYHLRAYLDGGYSGKGSIAFPDNAIYLFENELNHGLTFQTQLETRFIWSKEKESSGYLGLKFGYEYIPLALETRSHNVFVGVSIGYHLNLKG